MGGVIKLTILGGMATHARLEQFHVLKGAAIPMFSLRPRATLIAILVIAWCVRGYSLGFGLPALYDPDEPIFVLTGLKLLKNHTLNPGWFGHPGSTTIYCMALIELGVVAFGMFTGRYPNIQSFGAAFYHNPGIVFGPGRWFILLCALICIFLSYRIASKLFDARTALLSTLLLALDPLDIHYSQVIRTDMHASVFMLLAVLASISVVRNGRTRDYIFAGIWVGLACTTKWPGAAALLSVLGASGLRLYNGDSRIKSEAINLSFVLLSILAAMFVSSPFIFFDFHTVLRDLGGEAQVRHLSTTGGDFFWNAGWYFSVPLRNALGLTGLALLLPGVVIATQRSREALVTMVPLTVIFYFALCTQGLIQMRWVVPVLPLMTIFVVVAALHLLDTIRVYSTTGVGTLMAAGVIALLVIPPAATARSETIERLNDTRRAATDWGRAHIPSGSSVTIEYFAFDIVTQPWTLKFPAGDPGCINVADFISAQTPYAKVSKWRDNRALVDLGTVNPANLETCRSDYIFMVDYDRYLAEQANYGPQLAIYRQLMSEGHQVAVFAPIAGQSGGPIVRIFKSDRSTPTTTANSTAAHPLK